MAGALLIVAGIGGAVVSRGSAPTQPAPSAGSAALPFDMPSTATLRASGKKVFAHWVPTLPLSMDNVDPSRDYYQTQFLNPNGENGKHKAYGGWLRDRPLGRAPLTGDWRIQDMETDVRNAIAAGIDGFTVVIYNMPTSATDPSDTGWQNVKRMMTAANNVDPGFKIVAMPDFTGNLKQRSVANLAMNMAELTKYPAAYRLGDGRFVISPFGAQQHPADWWKSFNSTMSSSYGKGVALVPLLVDESVNRAAFAPVSYGLTIWGSRSPAGNDPNDTAQGSQRDRIKDVQALGKIWMQPVSAQDSRPRSSIFEESENTTNLRNTWRIAIDGGANWVQMATWSDFPENSEMAPTTTHGYSLLDISSYYNTWYKTGSAPRIVRDTIYLSHRNQPLSAKPTFPQTELMHSVGASTPRDTVEALTFLTAPATVLVRVGAKQYSCAAQAGVDTCTVPLGTGKVSASVVRNGARTAGVTSPVTVTNTPYVQDRKYGVVSSGRQPSDGSNGTASTSFAQVSRTLTTTPSADTYVDQNAPTVNFAKSSQVVSRGKPGAVSYLRFPVPAAPAGMKFASAKVTLRTSTASGAGSVDSHKVSLVTGTLNESSANWNNRPAVSSTGLGTIPANTGVNRAYDVSLTGAVVSPLVGRDLTMAVTSTGTDNLILWTTGHSSTDMHPKLAVTYVPTSAGETPAGTPSTTAPSPTATPSTPSSPSSVVTLKPAADTYADQNAPSTNFAGSSQMFARSTGGGAAAYLRFNLPSTPAGKTLTSAVLKYHTTTAGDAGSTNSFKLTVASSSWTESAVTWKAQPALQTDKPLGTISGATTVNKTYSTALSTSVLKGFANAPVTVAVTGTGSDNLRIWSTGQASSGTHPQLVLTYS